LASTVLCVLLDFIWIYLHIYSNKIKKHTKDSWSQNLYLLFNAILKIEHLLRLKEILLCSFFKLFFLSFFFFFFFFLFKALITVSVIYRGLMFCRWAILDSIIISKTNQPSKTKTNKHTKKNHTQNQLNDVSWDLKNKK
jgi:hypothetical protein